VREREREEGKRRKTNYKEEKKRKWN